MDEQPPINTQNELKPQTVATENVPQFHHGSFSRKKSMLPMILFTLLLAGGLGAGRIYMNKSQDVRSRASNDGPVLTLSPSTKSLGVGHITPIGITINTHDDTVSAVELHLTYDKTAIEATGFAVGTVFPVILKQPVFANGTLDVILGVEPTTPFKGSGIVGTINVKSLAAKSGAIQFTDNTKVAAIGKTTNVLASKTGSMITGTVAATPTSTPILTPTPTRKPGTTATPSPTRIAGTTTTPTPTRRPGTTATPTSIPTQENTTPETVSTPAVEDYSPFGNMKETKKPMGFSGFFASILDFFKKLF
jgi:hypothetical protein